MSRDPAPHDARDEHRRWVRSALADHERALVNYAARITGDLERARDVVQETFLRLCRQEGAELEGRVREWLFTVCRNLALDVRAKESRMSAIGEMGADRVAAREAEPGFALEQGDAVSAVMRAIGVLPASQQEVLVLKFRHGLAYKEIAQATGHSVGNVGYLIHHGVRALRAKLAGDLREGLTS